MYEIKYIRFKQLTENFYSYENTAPENHERQGVNISHYPSMQQTMI